MPKSVINKLDLGLVSLGFFVALFSTGIGIGGGALLVPILISVFKFDFKKATSTSLATIIPISFIGSVSHFIFSPNILHLRYYFIFIPMCIIGAILGGNCLFKWRVNWLKFAFSIFLISISLKMLNIFDLISLFYCNLHNIIFINESLIIMLFGLIIGFVAILLGIGCGLLIVPFYIIIIGVDIHEAIKLSLTTMFFLTFLSTAIHNRLKILALMPLKSLLIPAVPGAIIGAIVSSHLSALALKPIFGTFLFLIASKYIVEELFIYFNSIKYMNSRC
ncbi:MAG: hypothetical protein AVO38_15010 [delta proteobacterium ML8_D]|jgi:uncharacterized protein|nr:MAG: hypothetical protein AVO38_15010 [delta proteobacterium ML8_D]